MQCKHNFMIFFNVEGDLGSLVNILKFNFIVTMLCKYMFAQNNIEHIHHNVIDNNIFVLNTISLYAV